MPQILHESTGLRIHKNDKNKFCIVSLHYTADPIKRDPDWIAEAKSGMQSAQWAKEMEIDYAALYGQRSFPEFASNKSKIIIPEPYPEFPYNHTFWGGFDYGMRSPSSFHVYTIMDDVIVCVWELYEPCRNIPEFAQKMKDCPYFGQIKYIACDPTIISVRTQRDKFGNLITVGELFNQQGIRKLVPGNTDEQAWMAMLRQHWAKADDPTFQIYDCCANLIREFENAVYAEANKTQQLDNVYKESLKDANNHALDDCKYFMNSRPQGAPNLIRSPKSMLDVYLYGKTGKDSQHTRKPIRGPWSSRVQTYY